MHKKFLEKFAKKLIIDLGLNGVKVYESPPEKGMIDSHYTNYGFIKPLRSFDGPMFDHSLKKGEGCYNYDNAANYFFIADLCDCLLEITEAHEKILRCFFKYCDNGDVIVTASTYIADDIFTFDIGKEDHGVHCDDNNYVAVWFQVTTETEDCIGTFEDLCLFKRPEESFS